MVIKYNNMKNEDARDILEYSQYEFIDIDNLKKRYRKLALKYHPDKNKGSNDSKQRFQLINEAYLQLETSLMNSSNTNDELPLFHSQSNKGYNELFHLFMESFASSHDFSEISIVKEIVLSGCKKLSIRLFENMSKDNSINTLSFLCRYKDILHIDKSTIDTVKQIIAKKYENDQVIILNPTMDDMLDCNIYKLQLDNKTYFVPLWHSEAYFDGSDGEIIVKCVPLLPDNVEIDDYNVIHVRITKKFSVEYFTNPSIIFSIGTHKFEIPKIRFKKTQTYFLENYGLPPIDVQDVYNLNTKMGMNVTVNFID